MLDDKLISNDVKIRVEMVCECGNTAEPEGNSCDNRSNSSGAIILYNDITYICDKCGVEMKRRIIKTTKTETETEVLQKEKKL